MDDYSALMSLHYLKKSTLERKNVRSFQKPDISAPPPYKTYPDAERIALPTDWKHATKPLENILQRRRSQRGYSDRPLPLSSLAFLLWAGQGITARSGNYFFRTAPSAGALYPIETYISVQRVDGLQPGIYHLDVVRFELELMRAGDHSDDIVLACLSQQSAGKAAAVFLWSAVFRRTFSKYGERGMRYVFMDAAHICQNVLLAAEAVECGACPIGAFFDAELNELLGLDGEEESVIYTATIGTRG